MAEQDWLQELPEAYRDPARIKDALAHVQELEAESGRYKDFYEKSYMPWVKEHGTNFQEYTRDAEDYRRWKQGDSGHPAPGSPPEPSNYATPAAPNFDDPNALEHTYHSLQSEIGALRAEQDANKAEVIGLKNAYEGERNNVYQLIALQEQAYGLLNSELYTHLDWKPQTNIRDVASYAKDHGLADLTEAAQQLYRGTREKSIEQAAYDRAKRDFEAAQRNERVTTEMGGGTPLPELRSRTRPEGLGTGYGNANLTAMQQAIAERRAGRRMATS